MLTTTIVALSLTLAAQNNPMAESLPRTEGEIALAGLTAEATVERDGTGMPRITAGSIEDAIRVHGFVHAQDRYFQMDSTRRLVAGRLAAAIGPMGLDSDERYRPYQFAAVADGVVEGLPPEQRRLLEVYAEGVNAGLADLEAAPPEYVFLNMTPEPWAPRDSILVVLAMFDFLNLNADQEKPLGVMRATLPEKLVDFLTPMQTRFDALLFRPHIPALEGSMPIPGPDVVDLRERDTRRDVLTDDVAVAPLVPGSNSWAIAGSRTTHGGAIVANDPHLEITVPIIWYRSELAWGDRRTAGVSLPGSPGIVIGSNGDVAWGLTNMMGDFQDLIVVEVDPDDPTRYRTPDGFEAFGVIEESIAVRGREPVAMELQTTRWGVVIDTDWQDRPLVMKWTALDPDMINMGLFDFMTVETLEAALDIASTWHGPAQNVVVADANGRIGWTVSGWLPRRRGFDGSYPVAWTDANIGWPGQLEGDIRPRIVDPPEGLLYTANNRTVPMPWAGLLGNTWDLGLRAGRIRTLLEETPKLSERDCLRIQLDTRVEMFDFYRDLLEHRPPELLRRPLLREAIDLIEAWDGTADVDQRGLTVLDAWRWRIHREIIGSLTAPCRDADPSFRYFWLRGEEPVRRVLETHRPHLLPPGYADWDVFVVETLHDTARAILDRADTDGLDIAWGDRNRAAIGHPFAAAIPSFANALSMPKDPQAGHMFAVRVASPSFGASMRMAVSPGREPDGYMHAPCGQSGHPFSAHFRDGHAAWQEGAFVEFSPGATLERLVLTPE